MPLACNTARGAISNNTLMSVSNHTNELFQSNDSGVSQILNPSGGITISRKDMIKIKYPADEQNILSLNYLMSQNT